MPSSLKRMRNGLQKDLLEIIRISPSYMSQIQWIIHQKSRFFQHLSLQPSTSGVQKLITSTPKESPSASDITSQSSRSSHFSAKLPKNRSGLFLQKRCSEALSNASVDELIGELQSRAPLGCKYVISLAREEDIVHDVSTVLQACWSKNSSSSTTERKRRRINTHSVVITHDEAMLKLRQQEEEKENKGKGVEKRKAEREEKKQKKIAEKENQKRKKAKKDIEDETTSESDTEIPYASDTDSDIGLNDILYSDKESDNEPDPDPESLLEISDSDIGKFFAVLYTEPQRTYYWGKLLKTFSHDENTPNATFEFDFLKKNASLATPVIGLGCFLQQ